VRVAEEALRNRPGQGLFTAVPDDPPVLTGFALALAAGLVAALANALGAPIGAWMGRPGARSESLLLGLTAGVMLAACFTSLFAPALEFGRSGAGPPFGAVAQIALGAAAGAFAVAWLHRHTPHEHFIKGPEGADPARLARRWRFVFAIALHNIPEGLALGVGAATGDAAVARPLTLGIALQNLPEGAIVAASLASVGYSRRQAIAVAVVTGLIEPVLAMVGYWAFAGAGAALPFGLAFAAGAMLFVVAGEVIPEAHRDGTGDRATWGLVLGVIAMVALDALVG